MAYAFQSKLVRRIQPEAPAVRTILFPTDFSTSSFDAFKKLLSVARRKSSQIILYYKFDYVIAETMDELRVVPAYHEYMEKDVLAHHVLAERWSALARQEGVEVETILDRHPGFVVDSILSIAEKRKVGMIAFASHRGPIASILFGGIARDLSRRATCALWKID